MIDVAPGDVRLLFFIGKRRKKLVRYDVMKETYTEIRVLEKPALFSGLRLNWNTVPEGMYLYEVRHDDYGKGDPVQIGKGVLVNFWGSILTCEPLDLEEDGRLDIDPEQDWDYLEGKNCSIREFMEKYSGSIQSGV